MKKELLADKRKMVRKEMELKKIEEDDTLEQYNADKTKEINYVSIFCLT